MKTGDKVALVCCSNGQPESHREQLERLGDLLSQMGLIPVFGDYIYQDHSVFSGSARQRAESLMNFYKEEEIRAIFDLSGGDLANEILPYLDYSLIAGSDKSFWGYSDLTTVINAIYAKTGKSSVLYQVRNLVYADAANQIARFTNMLFYDKKELYTFSYDWIQKGTMQGIVVGGNIRCLLKLAGTPYWPDMKDKILLLEAFHGTVPQMVTYLSQLKQMGVFDEVGGILLGTFTEMEEKGCVPSIVDLVIQYAGSSVPIAKTGEIGHGEDAKAILIGEKINLA
ncbi:MAG: LD-carboxypeptidase [Lachnospiraceae bacterium]|nr:LD-carboxypeptidase [Lachnospiraceae bacterium]